LHLDRGEQNMSTQNIEVEVRALIPDISKLRTTLKEKGAEYQGKSFLHDIYFCRKNQTSISEVEMHEVGSYSLRLRKSRDTNGLEKITLNSKTITSTGDHNAWEEHETDINNFKETALLLHQTEFKPFFELKKTRYTYSFDDQKIFIEEIEDYGDCIEIEIMTSQGKEDAAKEKILSFLEILGINKSNIVPKSVTNLIMKERAFKKSIRLYKEEQCSLRNQFDWLFFISLIYMNCNSF
jgi:predicted adenylyl cyclase CyaB